MWETVVAGAGGLMGLYIAIRLEVRRSHELLQKDISHLDGGLNEVRADIRRLDGKIDGGLSEVRADIRRLDGKIDAVRGELIGFLGPR
jgi:hypothetical protein